MITPELDDTWIEIGQRDKCGRRSLWVLFDYDDSDPGSSGAESVRRIHIRAGREGRDVAVTIERGGSLSFERLYDILASPAWALITDGTVADALGERDD